MQSLRDSKNSMDLDSTNDENEMRPVVEIVEEILAKEAWQGQRASKLDIDDFLQLLSEFNEAGIHFCQHHRQESNTGMNLEDGGPHSTYVCISNPTVDPTYN